MRRFVREPLFITRLINLILGIVILVLFLMILFKDRGTEIYEILLFAFAAAENFISATIGFLEGKKLRANIYASVSGVFFIVAFVLVMGYFVLR